MNVFALCPLRLCAKIRHAGVVRSTGVGTVISRRGAEPNVMNENTIGTRYKKTFLGTGSYRIPAMDQGVHPLPSGF